MAFAKSSLPLLLGPFINSFIMICESMLSVSQDGLLREICCYQNIDYRYLIIYTISNTSGFEINWGFFGGGPKLSPIIKNWVGGLFPLLPTPSAVTNLFSRAFQQLKYIGSGKCNPLENV
jgi:hypothetical protein